MFSIEQILIKFQLDIYAKLIMHFFFFV